MDFLWTYLVTIIFVLTLSLTSCHQNTFDSVVHNSENPSAMPPAPHSHDSKADPSGFHKNHIQNQDHILEHLDGVINKPESEMTEQELQFHYFKLHDYDNNSMLDGIEIIDAMTHYHKGDKADGHVEEERMPDEELMSVVDQIMKDEDLDKNGYISYAEFLAAQRPTDKDTELPQS